jgi:hypothetical protein
MQHTATHGDHHQQKDEVDSHGKLPCADLACDARDGAGQAISLRQDDTATRITKEYSEIHMALLSAAGSRPG